MLFLETHNEFIKIQIKIGVNGLLGLSQIRCIEHKIGKQNLILPVIGGQGHCQPSHLRKEVIIYCQLESPQQLKVSQE